MVATTEESNNNNRKRKRLLKQQPEQKQIVTTTTTTTTNTNTTNTLTVKKPVEKSPFAHLPTYTIKRTSRRNGTTSSVIQIVKDVKIHNFWSNIFRRKFEM